MKAYFTSKYANITKESLEMFKSYCIVCQEKRKRLKTAGVVVKPILSSDLNSRGQVDLVDMQSSPQAQFKWIMVHQCHLSKFVILQPLTSKRAAEVAFFNCSTSSCCLVLLQSFKVTMVLNLHLMSSQN
ncbi:KRAB-A domain-containing protein 2-like [Macrobrachium nipponense]|uniref:KRAB-A domain-containing protein 2-like n=1 Tax=Macrobrachium nipponense TaxID=159736 RepID=UPI0030C8A5C7